MTLNCENRCEREKNSQKQSTFESFIIELWSDKRFGSVFAGLQCLLRETKSAEREKKMYRKMILNEVQLVDTFKQCEISRDMKEKSR